MPKTNGILGRKIGMTRVYDENGRSIPVTVIEAGPCTILQKKTVQKEGYNAIQLGFLEKRESRLNKLAISSDPAGQGSIMCASSGWKIRKPIRSGSR